jgi:hypothetical protein
MPTYYKEKKPRPSLSFPENYAAHARYLEGHGNELYGRFWSIPTLPSRFCFLGNQLKERISCFVPLKDGHDYLDELVSATFVPLFCEMNTLLFVGVGLWEFLKSCLMTIRIMERDQESHFSHAMSYFMLAFGSIVYAKLAVVNSLIGLLLRPIITLCTGYSAQNKDRFFYHEQIPAVGDIHHQLAPT